MWAPLLSFLGAALGAGIPAVIAWRKLRQSGRDQWRQRLDSAIAYATAEDPAARTIGKELLTDLISSDLGSDADRDLAIRVANIQLTSLQPVDETESGADNEGEPGQEQS